MSERVESIEPVAEFTDQIEAPEDLGLPARNPYLALQHMEAALVRAQLAHPDVLSDEQFRRLRYLLSFARLNVFEPGAAGPHGRRGRGDVTVGPELASLRRRVLDALHEPLRNQQDLRQRLIDAQAALPHLIEPLETERGAVLARHVADFAPDELEREVCCKALVSVLGGGGGAGYVYIGGMQRLATDGIVPDYVLGSSFGSIVGGIISRVSPIPIDEYIAWAKSVTYRGIVGTESSRRRRRHGLPGLFALRFDEFADPLFRRADGERMTLRDAAIPYETVVAGVRRQSFDQLQDRFRRAELAALKLGSLPLLRHGAGALVAARLWQVAAFIDNQMVKPIVLGGDPLTAGLNTVDAIGFSCAIPGILHHESHDPAMYPILDELLAARDVSALVDGGAASNVPIELAWRRVQDGRLGTRNVFVYAWDCMHPQWDPKHLWLQPITQAIRVQMVRNAPFADRIVRFRPTLAVSTLAARPEAIDRALGWGRTSVEPSLPMVRTMLEMIWWDADHRPGHQPESIELRPVARPMDAVLEETLRPAVRPGSLRARIGSLTERLPRRK
ncbi:patatin-like phospholipase family protein [Skermania piniformis]|uniref:Patatin-like phospholipase family protein n=1 Tax=Skermania pinensis TaxID=39122 RepID=A0ABX8SC26_9ACTN|nr:patatin-like phospholipase family protein [Skermania piniformis]QXQ13995.1 patatin-like phospholipase family protein [Skermania piniformis]